MRIVAVFGEFERAMPRECTRNGFDKARKQGYIGGRRPKLKPNQQQEIIILAAAAARLFNVHLATILRLLHQVKFISRILRSIAL